MSLKTVPLNVPRMRPDPKVLAYLTEAIRDGAPGEYARCELRQATTAGDAAVRAWGVTAETDPEDLASVVNVAAREDAAAFRGVTTYAVCLYRDGASTYASRCMFLISGDDRAFGIGESEPASAEGLLAQLMRHNEITTRVAMQSMGDVISHYRKVVETKDARVERLERRQAEMFEATEAALSKASERALETRRTLASIDRNDRLAGAAMNLLPVVAGKLLAPKGAEAATAAKVAGFVGSEELDRFMASVTRTQFEKLAGSGLLDPAQLALLFDLYEGVAARAAAQGRATRTEPATATATPPERETHEGVTEPERRDERGGDRG